MTRSLEELIAAVGDGSWLPVAEMFHTVQGEGAHTGCAAYFVRLGGCDVRCPWCDARYTWEGTDAPLTAVTDVARQAAASGAPAVVITGGEPTLFPLEPLTGALAAAGLQVWMETSGTHLPDGRFDWICLSPKRHRPPLGEACRMADELKVVVGTEEDLAWAETCAGRVRPDCRLFLQPEWGRRTEAMALIVAYVKAHPRWRISLQTHKYMDVP